jgi:hypothetical protein
MEDAVSLQAEIRKDDLLKIQFNGNRDLNALIYKWLGIKSDVNSKYGKILIIDNMEGNLSSEGICILFELLSEYDFYRQKRIAIVLKDENSYSTRFFEIIAQSWGINTKHINNENEAVNWL